MWIDQVMKALRPDQQPVGQEQRGSRRRTEFPAAVTANGPHDGNVNQTGGVMDRADLSAQEDVPQIQKKEKLDITALAQQMAKDRDSYISDTAPAHKKGRGPQ